MATLLRATLVADLWGRARYGSVLAAVSAPYSLARAVALVGASLLIALGGYTTLLWILTAATSMAAIAGSLAVERSTRPGFAAARSSPTPSSAWYASAHERAESRRIERG